MDEQMIVTICVFLFGSSLFMAFMFRRKLKQQQKVGYVPKDDAEVRKQKNYQIMVYAMYFEAFVVAPSLYFMLTSFVGK